MVGKINHGDGGTGMILGLIAGGKSAPGIGADDEHRKTNNVQN